MARARGSLHTRRCTLRRLFRWRSQPSIITLTLSLPFAVKATVAITRMVLPLENYPPGSSPWGNVRVRGADQHLGDNAIGLCTGDQQRSDSLLHKDGNHGILVPLTGSRLVFVHKPRTNLNSCQLSCDGRASGRNSTLPDMSIERFMECYKEYGFVRIEANPGDMIFLERTRPHRVLSTPGSIALTLTASNIYWT